MFDAISLKHLADVIKFCDILIVIIVDVVPDFVSLKYTVESHSSSMDF